MKKIFALIIGAVVLTTSVSALLTGCKAPDAVAEDKEIDINDLPSKFNLRNADGKNYVTPVKSQKWGDCWSFSLAGSAEIVYLYANDMGVPSGKVNDQVDFSEKYIVWYMFHGITKDDAAKGKVRASQAGEGFDLSEDEKTDEMTAYNIGGPFVHSASLYGSGFGPVDESVSVKGELPYAYNDDSSVGWQLPLTAEYRNAPVTALFRDGNILPSPSSPDEKGKYKFN